MAKGKENILEVSKGKTRDEEEKFFHQFSEVQLNSVLLVILSATFLVQGILRYLEIIGKVGILRGWIFVVIFSIIVLVMSTITTTLGGIFSPLRLKRTLNMITFTLFIIGVSIFLISLFYLLTHI